VPHTSRSAPHSQSRDFPTHRNFPTRCPAPRRTALQACVARSPCCPAPPHAPRSDHLSGFKRAAGRPQAPSAATPLPSHSLPRSRYGHARAALLSPPLGARPPPPSPAARSASRASAGRPWDDGSCGYRCDDLESSTCSASPSPPFPFPLASGPWAGPIGFTGRAFAG
jgi:hypothetical protein